MPFAALRRSPRQIAVALLVLALTVTAALLVRREEQARSMGRAIYVGEQAPNASLVGHDTPLPGFAARCVNCHHEPSAASAPRESLGPMLNRALLEEPKARRGGPPSRYDAAALCTLLRSGVDPAHVMIPTIMPRYEVSDAQCAALWAYLASR